MISCLILSFVHGHQEHFMTDSQPIQQYLQLRSEFMGYLYAITGRRIGRGGVSEFCGRRH